MPDGFGSANAASRDDGPPQTQNEEATHARIRAGRGRWVPAAAYTDPLAAHIARLKLESDGFDCYLDNEIFVSTVWLYSIAAGGVKLMVREADVDAARESLREKVQYAPDLRDTETADAASEAAAEAGVVCPNCGSADVAPDRPWKRLLTGSLLVVAGYDGVIFLALAIPIMIGIALRSLAWLPWKCSTCAHYWWGRVNRKGFDVVARPPAAAPVPLPLPVPVLSVTPPPATGR